MSYKKNEGIQSCVTKWSEKGLAEINEQATPLLIPNVIPGERIAAKVIKTGPNYCYGKKLAILEPSPHRVDPPCDVAETCGGCQLQHVHYDEQLRYKKERVEKALQDLSHPKITTHGITQPLHYRQKGQFAVSKTKEGDIHIGLSAARSQRIVDTKKCWIQSEPVNKVLTVFRTFLEKTKTPIFNEQRKEAGIAHIAFRWTEKPAQLIVTLVTNAESTPDWELFRDEIQAIPECVALYQNNNPTPQWSVLSEKQTLLWGKETLIQELGRLQLSASPLGFCQSNAEQTERLWNRVLALLKPNKNDTIADLYCGSAGMSLFLAKHSQAVIGIEESQHSVNDAKENIARNQINNVQVIEGDVEKEISQIPNNCHSIIVDPPRTGLNEPIIEALIHKQPKKLVYISCNPESLARNLILLCEKGASITEIEVLDFFPQTYHIETLVLLRMS